MAAELGDRFELEASLRLGMVPLVVMANAPDRTRVHDKLVQVFLPFGGDVGRLLQHPRDGRVAVMEVWHGDRKLRIPVFDDVQQFDSIDDAGWSSDAIMSVFIPVEEMLSHGPGFRSLYAYREIQFEEIYADLIERAYLPPLRGALDDARAAILEDLEMAIGVE